MSSRHPHLFNMTPFPEDSAFAVACAMKAHLQQVAFDAEVEDTKKRISALLTPDYLRPMRVANEQELVKNVLKISQVPADEPRARR